MRRKKLFSRRGLSILLILCLFAMSTAAGCGRKETGKEEEIVDTATDAAVTPQVTKQPEAQPTATAVPEKKGQFADELKAQGWPEDFSLSQAYVEDFLIGTIYTEASVSGQDKELTLKHFNTITPENIMKPEYMQPTEGIFDYTKADVMLGFAAENKLKVHGHVLVWHQQSGNWLGMNVSREEAIEQLKSHITTIVGKYKGQMLSWDVVNEAVEDGIMLPTDGDWTKCLRKTQWYQSIGPDYIAMAFKFAREADPDGKLYYNDYNLNDRNKAKIVAAMVKDLKEQGVPVDGIGMQGHYSVDTTPESVEASLKLFSELSVEVSVTELDVTVKNADPSGLTKEQEIAQAVTYAKLFEVYKKYKDIIERVTFWGNLDTRSWRAASFPCLFNGDYTPKLAAYAVYDPEKFLTNYSKEEEAAPPAKTANAKYGTPKIDGKTDKLWESCEAYDISIQILAWQGATGTVRFLWDENYVYALFEVKDSVLNKQSENPYEHDSVELFLDQGNEKAKVYDDNDGQYRVNYTGEESFGTVPAQEGFTSAAKEIEGGYLVELAVPLLSPAAEGMIMGMEAQVNDSNESGVRQSIAKFNDNTDNSWQETNAWGNLSFMK